MKTCIATGRKKNTIKIYGLRGNDEKCKNPLRHIPHISKACCDNLVPIFSAFQLQPIFNYYSSFFIKKKKKKKEKQNKQNKKKKKQNKTNKTKKKTEKKERKRKSCNQQESHVGS